ncbi:MAG: hypothetical protein P4L49_18845 [Desulfosporosinus sp.]|nr:hypothetical protein [Desulfosporosinus sp.]
MSEAEKRIFEDTYKIVLKDMKYKRNTERAIELGRKIMALLDKNSLLFLEYERSASLAEGIYLENTYRIGVEEGMMQYKKSL